MRSDRINTGLYRITIETEIVFEIEKINPSDWFLYDASPSLSRREYINDFWTKRDAMIGIDEELRKRFFVPRLRIKVTL